MKDTRIISGGVRGYGLPALGMISVIGVILFVVWPRFECLVVAGWAAALVVAVYAVSDSPKSWRIQEDGLVNEKSGELIPFASIVGLRIGGRAILPNRQPISGCVSVFQQDRMVHLHGGHESWSLYCYLVAQIPSCAAVSLELLPATLRAYAAKEVDEFGADHVFFYVGRKQTPSGGWAWIAVPVASTIVGVVFVIVGMVSDGPKFPEGLSGIGFGGAICSFIWFLEIFTRRHVAQPGLLKDAGLVVSPSGIAMQLVGLTGKLRWAEVQGLGESESNFISRLANTFYLQTAGTIIPVPDLFNRPLATIYLTVKRYYEIG